MLLSCFFEVDSSQQCAGKEQRNNFLFFAQQQRHSILNFKQRIASKKAALSPKASTLVAVTLASIAHQAGAAIVSFDYNTNTQFGGLNFDPSDGTTGGNLGPNDLTLFACGFDSFFVSSSLRPSNAQAAETDFLADGSILGSSATYTSFASSFLSYVQGTPLFFGFRLDNQGSGFDETHYGWAEVVIVSNDEATLLRSAINTVDSESITIGAVPEPSVSLFGAAALLMTISIRKRR